METKSTARGSYKKHKKEFKVAVDFKPNLNIEPFFPKIDNGTNRIHPLYIEVRAKRQRTFFKSQYSLLVDVDRFAEFQIEELPSILLKKEENLIVEHLTSYIESTDEEFKISEWLKVFREFLNSRSIIKIVADYARYRFTYLEDVKGVNGWAIKNILQDGLEYPYQLHMAMSLSQIVSDLGVEGFNELTLAINSMFAIESYLYTNSPAWFNNKAQIEYDHSLLTDVIFYDKEIYKKISDLDQSSDSSLVSDIQSLMDIQYKKD